MTNELKNRVASKEWYLQPKGCPGATFLEPAAIKEMIILNKEALILPKRKDSNQVGKILLCTVFK